MLVYPPSRSQAHESCPAALTMLAAVLERAGYEVHLLDANAVAHRRDRAAIVDEARRLRPDVIGMSLVTPLASEAYRLAADLRGLGVRLLAGGPHATLLPEEPIVHGFDAVVVGEGELAVAEAVDALLGRLPKGAVAGWVYRDDGGKPVRTAPRPPWADLDALPPPARHLVDPAEYGGLRNGDLHAVIFSSRGCPERRTYCSDGVFGQCVRFRSAASILQEMANIHAQYGTEQFHFLDETMTVDRERMLELCDALAGSGLGLTWSMVSRIDCMDEEVLRAARRGGCVRVDYRVESGHRETLERIHRRHTPEEVERIVPLTAGLGMKPYVLLVLGFPWETPETIDQTHRLMAELAPYVDRFHPAMASLLIPLPGTEIYETYKKQHGFAEWWLHDERAYDVPGPKRGAWFEAQVFTRGVGPYADFFHRSPAVDRKIHDLVEFMWRHDLRRGSPAARLVEPVVFETSRRLHALSPALERLVFQAAHQATVTARRYSQRARLPR